nr:MAG: hypothetical protein [Microviridae sp.]
MLDSTNINFASEINTNTVRSIWDGVVTIVGVILSIWAHWRINSTKGK